MLSMRIQSDTIHVQVKKQEKKDYAYEQKNALQDGPYTQPTWMQFTIVRPNKQMSKALQMTKSATKPVANSGRHNPGMHQATTTKERIAETSNPFRASWKNTWLRKLVKAFHHSHGREGNQRHFKIERRNHEAYNKTAASMQIQKTCFMKPWPGVEEARLCEEVRNPQQQQKPEANDNSNQQD